METVRKIFAAGLLFLVTLSLFAGDSLDIVRFEDLKFNSPFEEQAFTEFRQGQENAFMLFAAIDPDVTPEIFEGFKSEFNNELKRINRRKFQRVKDAKKISMIYDHVNNSVLTRYREKILFPHLFVNGTFNCLTASAYYGLLMDSLGINYDIRETYDHVHPVAFPQSLQIKIETTDPIAGVEYYNERLKTKFVSYLLEKKVITRDEYYARSTGELFNRYFLPEASIGLIDLAGLHYLNDALYRFDDEDYMSAFKQIQKAYFIYPSQRVLTLYQFILAGLINNSNFFNLEDGWLLVYLSRLPEENYSVDDLRSEFLYITERLLFNASRTEFYDSLFELLDKNMEEGSMKDIISFNYYFQRGKSKLAQNKLGEGLELLLEAYAYNPHNLQLQSLIISTIAATFENSPAQAFTDRIESYEEQMPVLAGNGLFISLKMLSYLSLCEELFDFDEPDRALGYMEKFERLVERNPDIEINYEYVGNAYSAAAVYYFKRYHKAKAIEFLERGLKYAPENYELRYRLKSLRSP